MLKDKNIFSGVTLDVHQVAAALNCSVRHVHRLARTGCIPTPVHLGSLVRWESSSIATWIADGCPATAAAEPD